MIAEFSVFVAFCYRISPGLLCSFSTLFVVNVSGSSLWKLFQFLTCTIQYCILGSTRDTRADWKTGEAWTRGKKKHESSDLLEVSLKSSQFAPALPVPANQNSKLASSYPNGLGGLMFLALLYIGYVCLRFNANNNNTTNNRLYLKRVVRNSYRN